MRVAGLVLGLAILAAGATMPAQAQTLQPERLPGMCISMSGQAGESISVPCDGSARQTFVLPGPAGGPIRYGEACLEPKGQGYYPPLFAVACTGAPEQQWMMTEDRELRSGAGRCISLLGLASRTGGTVFAGECPKTGLGHAWVVRNVDFTNVVEGSFESKARPGMCIGYEYSLGLLPCTAAYGQLMSFDRKAMGQLRMMSSCISGGYAFSSVGLGECYDLPVQKWMMLEGDRLANQRVQCIEVREETGRDVLRTAQCGQALEQQWTFRPARQQ